MKNEDFRRAAGSFKYDDFTVVVKAPANGREMETSGVEIDFDEKKVIIKLKSKEGNTK